MVEKTDLDQHRDAVERPKIFTLSSFCVQFLGTLQCCWCQFIHPIEVAVVLQDVAIVLVQYIRTIDLTFTELCLQLMCCNSGSVEEPRALNRMRDLPLQIGGCRGSWCGRECHRC
jgi:hypothetical protein